MVTEYEFPPTPTGQGTDGTQEISTEPVAPEVISPPFANQPIETIRGLAAARPKSLGSEAVASLVGSICSQISSDLQSARSELKIVGGQLAECKIRVAVLEERIAGFIREDLPKKITLTLGTVMASLGFSNAPNFGIIGIAVGFIGLVLVAVGWFRGREEESR